MKVLALDHGRARTGVAVSDPTGTIARPLEVVAGADLARIVQLIEEHAVERVVVGLPLTLQGERGTQARETEAFVDAPTEQLVHGLVDGLADDVPARHLDAAEDAEE